MLPDFIWDPAKARANFQKHGVSFEEAVDAFEDPDAMEEVDGDVCYGEVRLKLIGRTERHVLVIVFTERGAATRIISARKARPHEQAQYLSQSRR